MTDAQDVIQVRLLGPLDVRRTDGSTVALQEWRTGKTMDLLRMLAIDVGRPVRTTAILQRLWADVGPERARGSLRTASSQIRRAVRSNCVVRQPEGLVLRDAWVDTASFLQAAHRASASARLHHHARVLSLVRSAEPLYRDDFHAHDDESDWVVAQRQRLRHARQEMLCDAAEAALELHLYRESLDFATTVVRNDRSSETGHRLVMRAHAALGDIGSALRAFEDCRAYLAEALGADPSPQTRDLHLRLLRGDSA